MQGHCQYGRHGQSCPNQHPSMCFKFLRYGTRECNKLDCTYSHPKMCKTDLTTVRCETKSCNSVPNTHVQFYAMDIARLYTKSNPKFKLLHDVYSCSTLFLGFCEIHIPDFTVIRCDRFSAVVYVYI